MYRFSVLARAFWFLFVSHGPMQQDTGWRLAGNQIFPFTDLHLWLLIILRCLAEHFKVTAAGQHSNLEPSVSDLYGLEAEKAFKVKPILMPHWREPLTPNFWVRRSANLRTNRLLEGESLNLWYVKLIQNWISSRN